MLLSLHLSNFMRHQELEVSFDPKETLIIGANWSGKTTIFKAILYAMFGPSAVPGGAEVVQRRGTTEKPAVTLSFSVGEAVYKVTRKKTSARLLKNDTVVATGPATVTAAVEDLLGMPAKLFGELRVSPQDEVGAILTLGVGRLNQIIGQITKADLIEKILKLLSTKLQRIDAELEVLPEYDLEGLKKAVAGKVASLNNGHKELTTTKEHLANKEAETSTAVADLKSLSTKVSEFYATVEESTKLKTRQKHLKERISKAEEVLSHHLAEPSNTLYQKLEKLNGTMRALEAAGVERAKQERSLETLLSALEAQTIELNACETAAAKVTDPGDGNIAARLAAVMELKQRVGGLHEKAGAQHEALNCAECPVCMRPYEGMDMEALVAASKQADEEYRAGLDALSVEQNLHTVMTRQKQEYQAAQYSLSAVKEKVKTLTDDIATVRAALVELGPEEDPTNLRDACNNARVAWETAATAEQALIAAQTELDTCLSELQLAELALAKLVHTVCPTKQVMDAASAKVDQLQGSKQSLAEQVASKTACYAAAYREYTRQSKEFEAAQLAEQGRKDRRQRAKHMGTLTTYLKRAHKNFVASTWESILDYASAFVSQCTNGGVTEMTVKDGSKFWYTENGEKAPITAASGMQRAIMGVAVRMALAEAIRAPAGVLLLDEVTAGATAENSLAMAQALSQVGPQVVLVSHRHEDAAVAQKVIQI